MNGEKMRRGDF